jgi:SagB-type dehydrogenase family enzyme
MTLEAVDQELLDLSIGENWEVFHENSKTSRHERSSSFPFPLSDAAVVDVMDRLRTVKAYKDFAKVSLPRKFPTTHKEVDSVLLGRETARAFNPGTIGLDSLAKILRATYGVTRSKEESGYSRALRVIPSGGALYPLEIYLQAIRVNGLDPGLYHFDPEDFELDVIRTADATAHLKQCVFQPDLLGDAAVTLFISAVFFRSTFKYGDRGYRFILLEAGHLAQNALLAANSLDIAGAPLGGYLDREMDRFLGLDGLNESVIYMLLLGQPKQKPPIAAQHNGS